jgi:serine/threonine protein kinase
MSTGSALVTDSFLLTMDNLQARDPTVPTKTHLEDHVALEMMQQVASGVGWLHEVSSAHGPPQRRERRARGPNLCPLLACHWQRGIIHRDLKANNVFVKSTAPLLRLKVGDFGLSHVCEPSSADGGGGGVSGTVGLCFFTLEQRQSRHGNCRCGCYAPCITASVHEASTRGGGRPWLSPETLENPHQASRSSDVYMLGGIMHEVLTGKYGVRVKLSVSMQGPRQGAHSTFVRLDAPVT